MSTIANTNISLEILHYFSAHHYFYLTISIFIKKGTALTAHVHKRLLQNIRG